MRSDNQVLNNPPQFHYVTHQTGSNTKITQLIYMEI